MSESLNAALIHAQSMHQQVCRNAFSKLDLSEGQPKILLRLYHNDGLLQKELSEKCGVKPATMTSLLTNMIFKGLVEKKEARVPGGKHGYQIFLTAKGRETAEQVAKIMNRIEDACFRDFSDKEKKRIIEYLGRIEDNLKDYH